jgi:hypothetical protein
MYEGSLKIFQPMKNRRLGCKDRLEPREGRICFVHPVISDASVSEAFTACLILLVMITL